MKNLLFTIGLLLCFTFSKATPIITINPTTHQVCLVTATGGITFHADGSLEFIGDVIITPKTSCELIEMGIPPNPFGADSILPIAPPCSATTFSNPQMGISGTLSAKQCGPAEKNGDKLSCGNTNSNLCKAMINWSTGGGPGVPMEFPDASVCPNNNSTITLTDIIYLSWEYVNLL